MRSGTRQEFRFFQRFESLDDFRYQIGHQLLNVEILPTRSDLAIRCLLFPVGGWSNLLPTLAAGVVAARMLCRLCHWLQRVDLAIQTSK